MGEKIKGKKMEVYVNLHPTYTYANVMVCGFIKELKEYVKLVDWLVWDYSSGKGRPFIMVKGENHIEKVAVLLQRISDYDAEIHIRDSRSDEWTDYKPKKIYTEGEMIAIEQKRDEEPKEWRWARESLEEANNYITMYLERGKEPDELLLGMKKDAEERIEDLKDSEESRLRSISKIWK